MPTGYTAVLLNRPDMPFREFALRCARAFRACIMFRDDSLDMEIPDEVVPSVEYWQERISRAKEEIRKYSMMSLEEASKEMEQEYQQLVLEREKAIAAYSGENAIYQSMIDKIEKWNPPTTEHEGLKKFMIEQCKHSMTNLDYYKAERSKCTPRLWIENKLGYAKKDLESATELLTKEIESAATSTRWLRDLRDSL